MIADANEDHYYRKRQIGNWFAFFRNKMIIVVHCKEQKQDGVQNTDTGFDNKTPMEKIRYFFSFLWNERYHYQSYESQANVHRQRNPKHFPKRISFSEFEHLLLQNYCLIKHIKEECSSFIVVGRFYLLSNIQSCASLCSFILFFSSYIPVACRLYLVTSKAVNKIQFDLLALPIGIYSC